MFSLFCQCLCVCCIFVAFIEKKLSEIKSKILSIRGLVTTSTLNAIENKMPDVSNSIKKQNMIQKLLKLKRKLLIKIMVNILILQNYII